MERALFYVYGAVVLVFGVWLSGVFSGLRAEKVNAGPLFGMIAFCGVLQIVGMVFLSEELVWKLYPVITHLPMVLCLCAKFRKRLPVAIAAVLTAYLCCQPAKWVSIFVRSVTDSAAWGYLAQILALSAELVLLTKYLAPCLAELFNRGQRRVYLFGAVPAVFYLYDYLTVVYADAWNSRSQAVAEFIPSFLCVMFVVFCGVYYRVYEEKTDRERNEQIARVIVEQQEKQITDARRNEKELRILRHDMRMFLDSLAVCIESGEKEDALDMVHNYSDLIRRAKLEEFCRNKTINYVLSGYREKCLEKKVELSCNIKIGDLSVDEMLFASILSNALDNALNAQEAVPQEDRRIRVMIKQVDEKLLLSVKNPTAEAPVFVDGLPVADRKGHGYGTQSIRYLTQRMGGNCQFASDGGEFALRVII